MITVEELAKKLYERRTKRDFDAEGANPFKYLMPWSEFEERWREPYRQVAKDALEILGLEVMP